MNNTEEFNIGDLVEVIYDVKAPGFFPQRMVGRVIEHLPNNWRNRIWVQIIIAPIPDLTQGYHHHGAVIYLDENRIATKL